MLLIILTTFFLFVIFCGFSSLDISKNENDFLCFRLIKGIFIVAILSGYSSIFIPLNLYFELFILVVGIGFFIYNRQLIYIKQLFYLPKSFFYFTLILVFVSSMNAYIFDTFSYYLPTIKWLDDYGLVKGLANFDFNLGQTSLWHILSASFNQIIDPYYKINFFITLIYLIFIYETKKYILLFALPFFYLFLASPSPDLPVIVLSIIAIINYSLYKSKQSICFGFIVGAMLVLMKPIAFVLVIYFFVLWLIDVENKSYKEIVVVIFIGLLFIIKNIILTANVTFPLAYGNLSSLSYSIPKYIYYLSSIDGRYSLLPNNDSIKYECFKTWSTSDYYLYIFKNINFSIALYILIALINSIFLIHSIFRKDKRMIFLASLMIFKVIVFFIISIQYRFILDNLLIILSLFLIEKSFKIYIISIPIFVLSILFVFFVNLFSNSLPFFMRSISRYAIHNLIQPKIYKAHSKQINYSNFKVNYITNTIFSLDVKQPALNKRLLEKYKSQGYYPKLINKENIKDGFEFHKSIIEEKKDSK
ncbi:LIC_10190 family membrane protein [Chishuiella sp.]|uniref:LIC_10190 family membrane protein n=1 Tax=Chishuiella sp. TaxID=1969467 RepID=UPI0028AF7E45|nr:hypothetical protein [Chishuiella sp.]